MHVYRKHLILGLCACTCSLLSLQLIRCGWIWGGKKPLTLAVECHAVPIEQNGIIYHCDKCKGTNLRQSSTVLQFAVIPTDMVAIASNLR